MISCQMAVLQTVANTGVVLIDPLHRHANIDAKCYQYTRVGIYTYNPATGFLTF